MSNLPSTRFLSILVLTSLAFLPAEVHAVDLERRSAHPGLNRAQTSIAVADAASGKEVAEYAPDMKLNPASCAKIFTAAAALATLGPEHRFRTDFFSDRAPESGTIGTLYVAGDGDPLFINEEISKAAAHLLQRGIRRIEGGITIDNSAFDSYDYPHKQTGQGRAYTAPTAATAVNFNSATVRVGPGPRAGRPASVVFDPPTDAWKIVNRTTTGGKFRIAMNFGWDKGEPALFVTGRVPLKFAPQEFYRSVPDPALHAAAVIASWLGQAGIEVRGPLREGRVPAGARGIMSWESRQLADVVGQMNKVSNNFIAEQILKHLGAIRQGKPGSTTKGIAVIEEYLASIGIPRESYTLENGSGLSAISRVSARQLVKVLTAAYQNPRTRTAFMTSLSVLGLDGTTKRWRVQPPLEGRALVKTGTLDGVSTLAGYAPTPDGRVAAFAILANGIPRGAWTAHEAQLEIVRAIAEENL